MSLVFNLIYLILLLAQMFIQHCSNNLENYKKEVLSMFWVIHQQA